MSGTPCGRCTSTQLRPRGDHHARIGHRRQHRCFQRGERHRPAAPACQGRGPSRRDREPANLQPDPPGCFVHRSPGLPPGHDRRVRGHRWLQRRVPRPCLARWQTRTRPRDVGDGPLLPVARRSAGSWTDDPSRRGGARPSRRGRRTWILDLAAQVRGRSIGDRPNRHGERPPLHDRRRGTSRFLRHVRVL